MIILPFFSLAILILVSLGEAAWLPTGRTERLRRQTSGLPPQVPSQCQSVCAPPMSTLQTCSPPVPSCLCTKTFQNGLFNCFICLGKAQNATDYSVPQLDIDEVTTACDGAGSPLPKLTFPGQNPNRPLTTSETAVSTRATSASTQRPATTQTAPTLTSVGTATTHISSAPSGNTPPQTQTAPSFITTPLSTAASTGSAVSTGDSSTTSTTTTPGNGACKEGMTIWMMVVGVLLATISL